MEGKETLPKVLQFSQNEKIIMSYPFHYAYANEHPSLLTTYFNNEQFHRQLK